jgi:RHS repeat-associated protein
VEVIRLSFSPTRLQDLGPTDLAHRYLLGNAVDQILADEQLDYDDVTEGFVADRVLWPLVDQVGTARDLAEFGAQTDTTTIANHHVYDSFGNLQSETNAAVDCLFGFTARPFDKATGLQNNLNRWYDPAVGTWASEDPIGFNAHDPNLYRYARNCPTNATDSTGLDTYRQNRWIGYPDRLSNYNPISHSFVFTTDEYGPLSALAPVDFFSFLWPRYQ